MKRLLLLLPLTVAVILCAGCGATSFRVPVKPPAGLLFTDYKAPLTVDFHQTTLGAKSGEASTFYVWEPIFGTSYAWGGTDLPSLLEAAKRQGDITTLTHAHYEFFNVLGIFARFTVSAHGS